MTLSIDRAAKPANQAPLVQLELPFLTMAGKPTGDGCDVVALLSKKLWSEAETAYVLKVAIPGLDSTLCRCEQCTGRANGGIWWFDPGMRHRILKRIMPYNFSPNQGDLCRDDEAAA